MSKTGIAVLITSIILGITLLTTTSAASNGYGYTGYRGYNHGPSFWYFGGGTQIYTNKDVRGGSTGGASRRGGGPGSGK